MSKKKSICVLAGCVCPETNDPTAKAYCPDWVVNVPEHEKDLSGRVTENFYTGCQRRRMLAYMLSMTASAGQAAASADKAATHADKARKTGESLVTNLFSLVIEPARSPLLIEQFPEDQNENLLQDQIESRRK